MVDIKSGKTTDSLLVKLLQDEFRGRLKKTIGMLSEGDFSSSPFAALVDITTKCNLGCPWCIDKYSLSNEEIPTNRMISLIKEFEEMDVKSIVYFGGGEPLVHEGADVIFNKTAEAGIDYALNTNGIFLDRVIPTLRESCSWTRVSWDAGDAVAYSAVHKGRDFFDVILDNSRKLAQHARGTVGVSFVVMSSNISSIVSATKLAKDIGCDFIQFKPCYTPLKSNQRRIDYYTSEESKVIAHKLLEAREYEDSEFAVLSTGSMDAVINKKMLNQNKSYSYCAAQQFVTLINPNGVYVCPNWRGADSKSIGDIRNNSLVEIWRSKRREEVIEELDPSRDCSLNCLRHGINVLVNQVLDGRRMGLDLLEYVKESRGSIISDRYFL